MKANRVPLAWFLFIFIIRFLSATEVWHYIKSPHHVTLSSLILSHFLSALCFLSLFVCYLVPIFFVLFSFGGSQPQQRSTRSVTWPRLLGLNNNGADSHMWIEICMQTHTFIRVGEGMGSPLNARFMLSSITNSWKVKLHFKAFIQN